VRVTKVRFTRRACEDLLDIWLYIEPRSPLIADQVYDRIEKSCQLLRDHPQLGPGRPDIGGGARVLVIERWIAPYRLMEDGVQIVRIVDGARDLTQIEWTPE
jgi:toxin ParE1/3/4